MTDETKWGEWRGEGDYRHFWRPLLNSDSFQELTPAYLNALEREVRDLRAYKVLADEIYEWLEHFSDEFFWADGTSLESDEGIIDWRERYDALPGTSEGEQKK